jgi:hypothetical protein
MGASVVSALKTIAAAGVLTAGGFVCPFSAHADDPCTGDPSCPHFAHLVCEQMDGGSSSAQVAEITAVAYNLTKDYAAWLVSGAIAAYCPWDKGK